MRIKYFLDFIVLLGLLETVKIMIQKRQLGTETVDEFKPVNSRVFRTTQFWKVPQKTKLFFKILFKKGSTGEVSPPCQLSNG